MGDDNIDIILWANEITIASQTLKKHVDLTTQVGQDKKQISITSSISKKFSEVLAMGIIIQVEFTYVSSCQKMKLKHR